MTRTLHASPFPFTDAEPDRDETTLRIPDELITVAAIVIGLGWVAVAIVGATFEFLRERRAAQS